ncbi:MAG: hypothetical protein HYY40_01605 [Bacteroidetes bacterium]|nr:hypothetical protein [Bacteroidota bacterium]
MSLPAWRRKPVYVDQTAVKNYFVLNNIKFILLFILLSRLNGFAQNGSNGYYRNGSNGFKVWKLTSLSGEVTAKGFYREYDLDYGASTTILSDKQQYTYMMGGALLNAKSFFLHPRFFKLDITAAYYPETNRRNYNVVPDLAEVTTLNKLDIRGALFEQKKITITSFFNLNDSYQNRESITDIKSDSRQWGSALFYGNGFLPFSASYYQRQWQQTVMATNRRTGMVERVLHGRTNKSFFTRDKNELTYSHNESVNQNIFSTEQNQNPYRVKNIIDEIRLNNNIPFDSKRKYLFNSIISNFNQDGTRSFNRFQALENLSLSLPGKLVLLNHYNLNSIRQEKNNSDNQRILSSLSHKLYKNLNSRLFFEFNRTKHDVYTENISKTGIDLQYTRKIPASGRLTLSYLYFRGNQNMKSASYSIAVTNEAYTLSDGQIILLKRPYVDQQTVAVRNAAGTFTYLVDFDYILVDRYPYLEIVRVPGGQIANNATVYIDYSATRPGSYRYDTDHHSFAANIILFNRKFEIYYKLSAQDYKNVTETEYQTLNYFTQNTAGSRLDFGIINGGIELEDYKSTLIPYRRIRYFLNIQKKYRENILFTLNGNMQVYHLVNENINQEYSDVAGKIAWTVFKQTKLNFDLMYRKQNGTGIDLDMITAKGEITSVIRQLYLTAGLEWYTRNYIGEKINFKGAYLQLSRKF